MTDTLYKEFILDLYRNPLNKKTLARYDVEHREVNASCGDDITIQLIYDDTQHIQDIGYQGQGCAISQAAVSLLTDAVKGKSIDEIRGMDDHDVSNLLGILVSPMRKKCAMIGLVCLQNAVNKVNH